MIVGTTVKPKISENYLFRIAFNTPSHLITVFKIALTETYCYAFPVSVLLICEALEGYWIIFLGNFQNGKDVTTL